MKNKIAKVLIIAGSDSGGGAGIQGDIKTVSALGGYATTAITALTAQNTLGVFGIHEVPDQFIEQQIRRVLEDIGADTIKTGMLHKASVIETIANVLEDYPDIPLIIDPVMIAKGGTPLLQPDAIDILVKRLFPRAMLITPNIPEAELLFSTIPSLRGIAEAISGNLPIEIATNALHSRNDEMGAFLIKGGHSADKEQVTDTLISKNGTKSFTSDRINSGNTHGTGCALASAIATGIAQGMSLETAIERAREFVYQAILNSYAIGKGNSPINHSVIKLS